jgi:hypothetical protein
MGKHSSALYFNALLVLCIFKCRQTRQVNEVRQFFFKNLVRQAIFHKPLACFVHLARLAALKYAKPEQGNITMRL